MSDNRAHALYRFYADDGALLYVGITLDPGARWRAHRDDKPWWQQVAQITVETHSDRTAVLEAERVAILAERPRYNVIHNRGGTPTAPLESPQLDRLAPLQVGDWVALGLQDGRCPVGEITALDDTWVGIRLKEYLMGTLTNTIEVIRWTEVCRIQASYPEDADTEPSRHWAGEQQRVMDDQHLGNFQTGWTALHDLDGDPVIRARARLMERDGR